MSVIICKSVKKFNVFRRLDKSNSNFPYRGGKRGVTIMLYCNLYCGRSTWFSAADKAQARNGAPRCDRADYLCWHTSPNSSTAIRLNKQALHGQYAINCHCDITANYGKSTLKKSWFNVKVVSWALDKRTYMVRWNITNKRIYHCRPFHWNLLSKQSW